GSAVSNSRLYGIVRPRLPHLAAKPAVGFAVAGELLFGRVPLQLAAQAQGDNAQVTDAHGAVADFGIANRDLARADAIEEVAHVVFADIKALCIRRQRRSKQLRIAGLDPATRDKN